VLHGSWQSSHDSIRRVAQISGCGRGSWTTIASSRSFRRTGPRHRRKQPRLFHRHAANLRFRGDRADSRTPTRICGGRPDASPSITSEAQGWSSTTGSSGPPEGGISHPAKLGAGRRNHRWSESAAYGGWWRVLMVHNRARRGARTAGAVGDRSRRTAPRGRPVGGRRGGCGRAARKPRPWGRNDAACGRVARRRIREAVRFVRIARGDSIRNPRPEGS